MGIGDRERGGAPPPGTRIAHPSARDSDEDSGKIQALPMPFGAGGRIAAPFGYTAIDEHLSQDSRAFAVPRGPGRDYD